METVFDWDCNSKILSKSHRRVFARLIQCVLLCQLVHLCALLLGPANFELRITIYWVPQETIVNSFVISFETSLPRVVGHIVLFLCHNFTVPSTMGSLLLDDA